MSRIESVDTFKLLAITAIIVIHTTPYSNMPLNEEWYKHIGVFLNQISRFAVPYFFIISGYFYGTKINSGNEIKTLSIKILKKLFIIFVAWSFIYSLPHDFSHISNFGFLGAVQIAYFELMTRISDPITLIFQGTKVHLWFLVGISFAITISAIFLQLGLKKSLIIFAVILYIFGLLAKAYVDSPFGIEINFNTRNGPFFSTIFFVSGIWLAQYERKSNWAIIGILLLIFGLLMQFSEIYFIWNTYGVYPHKHDFVIGTYFLGVGVSLVALSSHPILNKIKLGVLGKYTLGMYVVHFIFVDIFKPLDEKLFNPFWDFGFIIIVLLLSLGTTILLSKNKYTKRIVL